MDKKEGKILEEWLQNKRWSALDLARELDMSKQNIYYHLKRDIISDDFKKALNDKGFVVFGKQISKINTGIPIYDITATASKMDFVNQLPENPDYYDNIKGYEDCEFGMYIYGHSMYPTIESGCLVLCKRVNDKSIVMYGEIYLIRTADYLMAKRLQKSSIKGSVLCTSDNAKNDSRFEPFDLPIDKVLDLFIIKGIIKKIQS